ncbi:hypothetical protein HBDW_18940 [Herbaspirillum sp. DW155]|uniref:helix-turn-helix transcriptional regulator n=1 Tax=Herbaspirillum sp. DW155 TaxID=3095609 RepID=UPI003088C8DE|nr:hypothetical protein HBDW_18940 [Herbaspirillum sp. DW155]
MATIDKRPLTEWEILAAKNLKAAWTKYKETHVGASQEWLAKQTNLGTQSTIAQYLNGRIQLNLNALVAICNVIEVDPRTISRELTRDLPRGDSPTPEYIREETATEIAEVISLYIQANKEARELALRALRSGIAAAREVAAN